MSRNRIFIAFLLISAGVLVTVLIPPPLNLSGGALIANIAYGDQSHRQKLDLYLPSVAPPFSLIVVVHGGGFMVGHKRAANPRAVIEAGLERGYAVASTNYRRSGEALFPAAVDDVVAAVNFLRENADTYGLHTQSMAVWGASAGGNLAAMAALNDDTNLQAAVVWFAPIRFDQMDAQFDALGLDPMLGPTTAADSPESRYLGVAVGAPEAAELVQLASPQNYISPDDPPVLIQHGTADRNVPILQSEEFAEALAEVVGSQNVEFDTIEGAGHGGAAFLNDENLNRIFAFLNARLVGN